ncbi:Tm-1-like ATP-binding domain-containing protein [Akkermansiaceae bacterium]|nr:Tm-1-like ATP-binding domain-containing protein [Akkermansiaceae bacterium]MDA7537043.1 Tm-1-like ATP-binding domain-containing protein [bacterium]MDA7877324.1 Tm-1-like ATP-binding domain-containing protein [Akkermansiaceae bacterium]MDA7936005.1 Tm-1-like ATP-binding domain-containing protein [bacterium]MDB0056706.1 Tm-1-like ATP-binding domain-containing protein [Akkermansiaceae bacterium]
MKTVAILATLDTKAAEADFMRSEIESLGGKALLIDLSLVGDSEIKADITKREIISAGGGNLDELLVKPNRERSNPFIVAGATKILGELHAAGKIDAAVSLGGTQGTSTCAPILQALPYGFPKVMLSTAASGDTSPFVGIKDITMMFAVSDILGLNVFSRKILANAAAAAWGMAQSEQCITKSVAKGVIGMSNLGVLTKGAMHAIELFEKAGYEVITFHAIGAGGDAMEQMMKEGIINAVFDYGLGEIADGVWGVLRAGGPERLTVAGKLGLPQVIVPGGSEHLGILVNKPSVVPEGWTKNQITWHSPYVFVPRLNAEEQGRVAKVIGEKLAHSTKDTLFLMPLKGVSSYSAEGGELYNPELDAAYWESLQKELPDTIEIESMDVTAEDPALVERAVNYLINKLEN